MKKQGPQNYIFEEFQYKAAIDFENLAPQDALSTATSLARKMHLLKFESDIFDLLRKPYIYEDFNPTDIVARLNCMNP